MSDVDILIVDDRRENLLVVESILASGDHGLVCVTSGSDALKQVLERDFAVILLDVMMPGMDGFELATIIKQRERSRHTPIIFLTAGAPDLKLIYRGYSVGAVDYMVKPLDEDVLRAKVGIFVELFRKDRRIVQQAEALRVAERRERALELAAVRTANEQRYRNLAEAIPHIVWTADPDGAITYVNQRWIEYTGQELADALRSGWTSRVHPDDATRCLSRWRQGIEQRQVFEHECRLERHDGDFRWHLCRAVPELDGSQLVAWLGTYTDLDDLHRAHDAAEQAVRARDEFLSIASHELRTPLSTLLLRLQSLDADLVRDARSDAKIQRKVESSVRQVHRLVGLIDNLLDVSRIAHGRLTLEREPFDLTGVVREMVDRFAETAAIAGVVLTFDSDGAVTGDWDRLRIEQIAENLISNALKYAPKAPVDVSVRLRSGRATLVVTDHGQGIPMADQDRIFGPFERAVSARNYGGLGLGLYIAHQNANAHGGTIKVVSEPGSGTTFVVELPVGC